MEKTLHSDLEENCMRLERELQAANAQIARKDEEVEKAAIACSQGGTQIAREILLKSLSAPSESTEAFLNEIRAKALEEAADEIESTSDDWRTPRWLKQKAASLRAKNGG